LKRRFKRLYHNFLTLPLLHRLGIAVGIPVLLFLLINFIFIFSVYRGAYGALPTYAELKNIKNNVASELYSADGKLIGKYFIQERTNTPFADLPDHLINALIATEDARFYLHHGIDIKSLFRVVFKSILLQQESAGGGSTLTQQLAKNLYPRSDHGLLTLPVNKVKEAFTASRLEKIYSKQDILTLYLNTVSFSENAFGIQTAAERYFSVKPAELNLQQSAVLVGMLKATHNYNPRHFPEASKNRRNIVFQQMARYEFISQQEADSLQHLPLEINYSSLSHNQGLAPYFREYLRQRIGNLLKSQQNEAGKKYNLYTDGLKIYTTIDSRLQNHAQLAMQQQMKNLQKIFDVHWSENKPWNSSSDILADAVKKTARYRQLVAEGKDYQEIIDIFAQPRKMKIFTWEGEKEVEMSPLDSVKHYIMFLNAGLMSMDPHTGDVKAWVGGINHKYFKFDHVNGGTKRQVGSVFKPFVYSAALEKGIEPCQYLANEQREYEEFENWTPRNADGQYEGFYSMLGALSNSINTISVDLLMQTGPQQVISLASNAGINSKIPEVPSIALGTPDISLFEMVTAYCMFANKGRPVTPRYLTKIEDSQGNVIFEVPRRAPGERIMSLLNAEIMLEMMKSVVNSGTAARLRFQYNIYNDIAGKTGTTQDNSDGWFMGITPNLVTGVWVGADDPRIHFRSTALGQGAATALPVFANFSQRLNNDPDFRFITSVRFKRPPTQVLQKLDCEPYLLELEDDRFDFWDILRQRHHEQDKERKRSNSRRKSSFQRLLKDIFG
ncbi:MAG: penicillin-binding protein 1A, partial [Cyclobacteriaceae bacterium]